MYYVCEKYTITVQYYIANCDSWEPRLTFLENAPSEQNLLDVGDLLYRTVNDCDGSLFVS